MTSEASKHGPKGHRTDDRERLDDLIRREQSAAYLEDMTVLEDSEALYAVALDMLREVEEAKARDEPCEWNAPDSILSGYDEETIYAGCGWEGFWSGDAPQFCPGCGHPVSIAPPNKEDEHE